MVEQQKPKHAFFNGNIVTIENAKVSVMTHALNYGTGVFGGLRGYWNEEEEQLFVFRPLDHFKRLLGSCKMMRIELDYTPQQLVNILLELLRTEGYRTNCYIRPLAYKGEERIGVSLHNISDAFTMFAIPFGRYVANEEGAHVHFSAWRRIDDNAIPARGKVTGAYANSSLIKSDAILSGYDEALVLNEDGHISEASSSNFFMIRDGVAITPPIYANNLEGIVRRSVIQLLQEDLGVEVVERNIDRTEIYIADEAFMCGTGVQMAVITQVEHRPVGDGRMGPISERLRTRYYDMVTGRIKKYRDWTTPVYVTEPAKPV